MLYIATWEVEFEDPDNQYLNVDNGTVCGVFKTHEEAKQRIVEYATSALFFGVQDKVEETENGITINVPGYVRAKFKIHEYDSPVYVHQTDRKE